MDLETLQVIFDMNTAKIQPKLDELQRKFDGVFGSIKHKMDMSDGEDRIVKQGEELNTNFKQVMDKFSRIIDGGSGDAVKAMSNNVKKMKSSTTKDVDAMLALIESKMESARAAQERMMNLKGLRTGALDSGDTKGAAQIDEQAASAQARMTRYQNQAKALAQELKDELGSIPAQLTRIARGMDENEGKINAIKRKIEALKIAETDAMKLDPTKGFDAEPSVATKQSRAIAEQIAKERAKMEKLIDSSDALNDAYGRMEDRSKDLKRVMGGLDTELSEGTKGTRTLRESFAELSNQFNRTTGKVRTVMSALGKVTGITRLRNSFRQLNGDSRGLMSRLSELGSRGSSSMNKLSRGSRKAQSSLAELKMGLRSLPAQFIVWGIGFEAMQKFSEGLLNAAKSNRQFNNSLNQIKANLITAFYPLYATIIPWLDDFMNVLAKATGWLAQFSAALFGMSNSAARSGAANLYKQTKAMGDTSTVTSKATKALQKQNAAITAHNRTMQQAVQKENKAIQARNAARRKALQDQNSQIKAANNKRKQAVEEANEKIKASNKAVEAAVAKQNAAQKKRIAELKKKYEDYKTSLMGFDEINTLDLSKDIPDYTPKKAKTQELKKYTPTPLKSTSFTPEATKTYTPKATKSTADLGYVPDGVDESLASPVRAFAGASEAAKKFKQLLKGLFKPIKEAWDQEGKSVINAFKYALKEIKRLISDIGRSFAKVWESKTGVQLIRDFLKLLRTMLGIIGDIAKAFAQAWEDHGAGTRYIRSIFNLLDSVLKTLNDIGVSFRKAWNDNGLGKRIASDLLRLFTNINGMLKDISDSFRRAWNSGGTGTKMFKAWLTAVDKIFRLLNDFVGAFRSAWRQGNVGTNIFRNILKIATNIGKTIGNLAGQFDKAWRSGKTGKDILHTLLSMVNDVLNDLRDMHGATAKWAKKLDFRPLLRSIKDLFSSVKGLNKTVWDGIDWAYKNVLLPLAKFTITKLLPNFFKLLAAAIKVINSVLKALAPLAKSLFDAFLKPIAKYTGGSGIGALKLITKALNGLSSWIDKHQKAVQDFAKVLLTLFAFKVSTKALTGGIGLLGNLNDKIGEIKGKGSVLKNLFNKITGLDKLKEAFGTLKDMTNLKWTSLKGGASHVKDIAKASWSKLKDGAKYAADLVSIGWSKLKTAAVTVVSLVKDFRNWSIWGKLAAGAQAALNAVMDTNPYVLLAAAIAAVVVVFVELYKHNKKFRKFVNDIYKNVTKWLGDAIKWIKKNWAKVGLAITNPVGAVATWFLKDTKTGKAIVKWGKARLKDAVNWAKGVGSGIGNKVNSGKKALVKAGSNVHDWLSSKSKKAFDAVKSTAKTLGHDISTKVNGAKKALQKVSSNIHSWISSKAKDAFKAVSDKAKTIGADVGGFVKKGRKDLTTAGSNIKSWVSSKAKDAFKTVMDKAKGIGKYIGDKVKDGKSTMSKASSNIKTWVNSKAKDAFKTVSDKAKGIGKYIHEKVNAGKSHMSQASTNIKSWVSGKAKDAFKAVSDKAKGIGKDIHSKVNAGKSLMESASKVIFTAVGDKAGKAFSNLESKAKKIGGKIASGLKSGVNGIKKAGESIANAIVGTIGRAVNGVIDGVKWILRHVGASSAAGRLSHWSVPHYARGGVHQGGLALVNDEDRENYQESYLLPNGQQGLFPKKRNFIADLPYGTKIKTAANTERDIYDQIPHYAKGINGTTWNFSLPTGHGDYTMSFGPVLTEVAQSVMDSVFASVKGISGSNVLWDANHPGDVINQFTSKYDNFSSSNSLGTELGLGANGVIRKGATSMVKEGLHEFAQRALSKMHGIIDAAVNAYKRALDAFKKMIAKMTKKKKKRKGREFGGLVTESDDYPLAEHNKAEMVVPLTKPRLALKYIDESLQRMGYTGTGVTMPGAMVKNTTPAVNMPDAGSASTAQVQGNGVSGMQQAIVNSVMMAMSQTQAQQSAVSGQPLEITVKIGDETLGKHAVKGINAVNKKNGRNMLNL